MANARRFALALLAVLIAASATTAVRAQDAGDTVIGDVRIRGAGVVQVQNQWFHLLGVGTFERDEVCQLGNAPYQCGLIAQGKLAELSMGFQYECTVREFAGDPRRWGSCVPYDYLTRATVPGAEELTRIWVRSGWAFAHRLHTDELVAEAEAARAAKRGMWAGTTPPINPDPPKDVVGAAFVLDGNALRIGGTLVRLSGADAPEAPQSCSLGQGRGSYFCGIVSRAMLVQVTMGKRIFCTTERREGDDRLYATCGEADAAGTGMKAGQATFNEQMVRLGWAVADRRSNNSYTDQQLKADNENIGLWQGTFTRPTDWRRGYR